MTSPERGASESSRQEHPAGPGAPEGDDELIDRLRTRAWNPGLRFDTARVPRAWIEERFGTAHLQGMRSRTVAHGSDGRISLESQTEEVAAYFADAPRGPLFSPITPSEVEAAEYIVGRPLPTLLRRVYTEVGDGGFGPDGGLASVTEGRRAPGSLIDWPCSVRMHARNRAEGLPPSWLYLTSGGCTMQWHLSLLAADNPVLLYDTDGWEPSWGENPHDGLRHATPSLRQWLRTWADGGNVWAQALSTP
ncbi:hypothetical protein [Streptomyces sp. NPDC005573]|uniref:hypothetical protein n=1 Tax=unclassified Streptomyces TaxID=2593676 RepID=UPI0033A96AD2